MPKLVNKTEENARIISVCMRPWTLNACDVTNYNPLLTDLLPKFSQYPHSKNHPYSFL